MHKTLKDNSGIKDEEQTKKGFNGSSFLSYDNKHQKSASKTSKTNKEISNLDASCIYEEEIEDDDVTTDSDIDDEEIGKDLTSSIEASSHVNDLIIKNLSNLKPRYY